MPKSGISSARLCLARWCRGTWRWRKPPATPPACWTTLPALAGRELTSNSAWRYWSVSKDRRLGRGLAALLGAPLFDEQNTNSASGDHKNDPPRNAPSSFDASTLGGFSPSAPGPSLEKPATEN